MADLKFIGVNFPATAQQRQANPVTDRLLINTLGPQGGTSGPLVVSPVAPVTGSNLLVNISNGTSTVLSVTGSGTQTVASTWANGTDRSWSPALVLDPSGAPGFGSNGVVHILIGSGLDPTGGSGTDGVNNPPAGSLMLQTNGTAWLKTGSAAVDWLQWGSGGGLPPPQDFVWGLDEFRGQPSMDWVHSTGGGGNAQITQGTGLEFYGYSGEGWAILGVSESSDDAALSSRGTIQLDSTEESVLEWRVIIADENLQSGQTDGFTGFMGWRSLEGGLLGVSMVSGTWELVYNDALASSGSAAVTPPALTVTQSWRFRLTATAGSVVLEGGIDSGPMTTLASITAGLPEYSWYRSFSLTGEPATDRYMMLDYVYWEAFRLGDSGANGGPPNSFPDIWNLDVAVPKALALPQNEFQLGGDPDNTQDSSVGFAVGSLWRNINTDQLWILSDSTPGEATWMPVGPGGLKTVVAGTYVVRPWDNGVIIRFTVPCVITVPSSTDAIPLRVGHETTFIGVGGVLEFVDAAVNIADPLPPSSQSRFTLETGSACAIKVEPAANTYRLFGDLAPASSVLDPLTDGDFSQDGLLLREGGVGIYDVIKINRTATTDPGVGDDIADGYTVGSLWINVTLDRIFQCTDNTAGAAVWARLNRVTDEEYAMFIGPNNKSGAATTDMVLFWYDDFGANTVSQYGSAVAGAGASIALTTAAGNLSRGRVSVATGTTATGSAWFRSPVNFFYSNQILYFVNEVVLTTGVLADGTDDYVEHCCGAGDVASAGFTFSYVRTQSANWQLVTWAAGTPTYTDSGIPVVASTTYRFRCEWDKTNIYFYINGTLVGTVAYSAALNATYVHIAQKISIASIVSKASAVDFAFSYCRLSAAR